MVAVIIMMIINKVANKNLPPVILNYRHCLHSVINSDVINLLKHVVPYSHCSEWVNVGSGLLYLLLSSYSYLHKWQASRTCVE